MKILELLKLSSEKLKEAGVPDPLYDAKQLLMYCLNLDDTHLFMAYQDECESGLEAKYGDLIEKRTKRIPSSTFWAMLTFMEENSRSILQFWCQDLTLKF